jgi:hypothetical protein
MDSRPWDDTGVDIADYFNYGLNKVLTLFSNLLELIIYLKYFHLFLFVGYLDAVLR